MRSSPGDNCLIDMYPPSAMCGLYILSLGDILIELQKPEFAHA
jgi:hypothetical protein